MYCAKCGTEQRDGYKYCPKCGTPYIEKDAPNEDAIRANKQIDETSNQSIPNDTPSITPQRDKTYRRFAKVGMWIIIVAIVLTFVRTGFGFSFWWYVYLIIFALVAMSLGGMSLPDSNDKVKTLDSNDVSAFKIVSGIGAIMLAILYLWGPLNSNYTVSHSKEHRSSLESYEQSSNSSDSDDSAHSWIQGTWGCDTPYGEIIIRIDGDRIYEDYGDGVMSGTYRIYDNAIHPNTGNPVTYELDMSSHRILDGRGGYFRKR